MSSSSGYRKRIRDEYDDDDDDDDDNSDDDPQSRQVALFLRRKRQLYEQALYDANVWLHEHYKMWVPRLEKPVQGVPWSAESREAAEELKYLTQEYLRVRRDIQDLYNRPPGEVIVMGSNESRQMGRPDEVEDTEPDEKREVNYPPNVVQRLPKGKIIQVTAGGVGTAALTQDGQVYTWGENDLGELGRSDKSMAPGLVTGFQPCFEGSEPEDGQIISVESGDTSLIYLTINGNVYTSGTYKENETEICDVPRNKTGSDWLRDNSGKLVKQPIGHNKTPVHVPLPQAARFVGAGSAYCAALLADGTTIMSWGLGIDGQLGRTAGMVAKEDDGTYDVGKLFRNPNGEYNIDFILEKMLTPAPVIYGRLPLQQKSVVSLACGAGHMLVVARDPGCLDPLVYCTGKNDVGQLGLGPDVKQVHELTLIPGLEDKNIVKVAASRVTSYALDHYHLSLYSFGICDKGQLGLFSEDKNVEGNRHVYYPTRVLFPGSSAVRISDIAAGENNALAIDHDGNLYTWGSSVSQATGHATLTEVDVLRPRKLDLSKLKVKSIRQGAIGASHSVLIADLDVGGRNI